MEIRVTELSRPDSLDNEVGPDLHLGAMQHYHRAITQMYICDPSEVREAFH
jgi:hypothetical protein